ncbi:MAG: cell surface protein [Halalkalicoccus sp.]
MPRQVTRRDVLTSGAVAGGFAIAGCVGRADEGGDEEHDGHEGASDDEATEAGDRSNYEVWGLDQGTDTGYIYEPVGDGFELVEEIDFHAFEGVTPNDEGAITPHMISFSSDYAYAAIACTNAGQTLVFRTEDRELVGSCPTGPGTHFAGFTPDDAALQADVIGEGTIARIDAHLEAGAEEFSISDRIVVDENPVFDGRADEFEPDEDGVRGRPICHDYTGTGYSYHTLGPGVDHSGIVIVDWEAFEVSEVIAPEQVRANCGTIAHPDDEKFYLTAGAPSNRPDGGVGEWYVFDANEHRPIDPETGEVVEGEYTHEDVARDSGGYDAHGFWFLDEELWIVNRETSDGLVIDPQSDEVIEEIETAKAPDIMWGSPDDEYVFVTLRGPEPLSGDPHAATGETPGLAVQHVDSRETVEVLQPDEGNPESDFHAVGVRPLVEHDEDEDGFGA